MQNKDYIAPLLLVFPIIILPLEGLFPFTIAGFSITALSIMPLALYAIFLKPKALLWNFTHPCVLIGLLILGWGVLVEMFHDPSSYIELIRNLQNLIFAVIVATLITDSQPLRTALAVWITVSTILGLYFILSLFAKVNIHVEDYMEASILRHEALQDIRLDFNWDSIGYLIGIGAVSAFGMLLERRQEQRMKLLLIFSVLCCIIGSSVLLYRGPILMIVIAGGVMLLVKAKRRRRTPLSITIFILAVSIIFMPQALPKRFEIKLRPSYQEEYIDPRITIYIRTIKLMPQYFLSGVGRGRYHESWGPRNELLHTYMADRGIEQGLGLHNAFLQFFVFYGIAALMLLVLFVFRAKMCLSSVEESFPHYLTIRGLAVCGFVIMMLSHRLYAKELGLIMGMLIAAERLGKTRIHTDKKTRIHTDIRVYP